ncbi:alpha/beta fold hydrolase [Maricurvus nonylphenolicus]|uniref:alpha/beta hydrolase family protein n=1 Tax=Maricurvus nonylphenolicus TaxID=1008307 RepID=UPI0036F25BDA
MNVQSVILTCADQQTLAAQFYECDAPKGVVVIGSALGVSQHYYKRFAHYLVDQGFHALTFDYRFTGDSEAKGLANSISMLDWGRQDIEAAIAFAESKGLPVYFVGHSIGGQLLGMAPSATKLSKIVLVASSAPYWRRWSFPGNLKIAFTAKVLFPLVTAFNKQFPCKTFGLGNIDIPSPFIRQWASWMLKRDYLFDAGLGVATENYANLKQDVLSLGFSDDDLAPEVNVSHLLTFFPNTNSELKMLSPHEGGMKALGHTGYFREDAKATFWTQLVNWLEK